MYYRNVKKKNNIFYRNAHRFFSFVCFSVVNVRECVSRFVFINPFYYSTRSRRARRARKYACVPLIVYAKGLLNSVHTYRKTEFRSVYLMNNKNVVTARGGGGEIELYNRSSNYSFLCDRRTTGT